MAHVGSHSFTCPPHTNHTGPYAHDILTRNWYQKLVTENWYQNLVPVSGTRNKLL